MKLQWPLLIVLSLVFHQVLLRLHLPAASLLGPMGAGIVIALCRRAPDLPRGATPLAQGLLGLMIAQALPPAMLGELALHGPLIALGTLATLTLSSLLGWLLSTSHLLPGTTAIWGAMPGAASVITLMSQDFGADARLVAFMQYLRVALVALSAALVAGMAGLKTSAPPVEPSPWDFLADPSGLGLTLGLAAVLAYAGLRLRLPGGAFLAPMVIGLVLIHGAGFSPSLPAWLMALAYAVIGWSVGLRFTPATLGAALGSFPRVLAATLVLLAACSGLALALHHLAGIDLLTAFLATSPGGADSIAIIATQVPVDVPFVMTMQMTRFLVILFAGPWLARFLSRQRG